MIGVALKVCIGASSSDACTVHTHTPLVVYPSLLPFHAAAGPSHTHLDDNEIHGPDAKLVQQGEQACAGVCK